jgi:hypothetical protein
MARFHAPLFESRSNEFRSYEPRSNAMSSFSQGNWNQDKYKNNEQPPDWQADLAEVRNKWRKRRRDRWERDYERGKEYRTKAGGIISEIIDVVVDAVDTAMDSAKIAQQSYQQQRVNAPGAMERYREETYKRLMKKLERTEKSLEGQKKGVVFSLIMATCFGVGMIVGDEGLGVPALVFGAIAAMAAYNVRETRQKLFRLHDEHREFLAIPSTSAFSSPSPSSFSHTSSVHFTLMEKVVLRHAYEHSGKVYAELLVIESEYSLSEVEQFLKHATEKRIASIEVDANGRTFYYFSTLDNSDPYSGFAPLPTNP